MRVNGRGKNIWYLPRLLTLGRIPEGMMGVILFVASVLPLSTWARYSKHVALLSSNSSSSLLRSDVPSA